MHIYVDAAHAQLCSPCTSMHKAVHTTLQTVSGVDEYTPCTRPQSECEMLFTNHTPPSVFPDQNNISSSPCVLSLHEYSDGSLLHVTVAPVSVAAHFSLASFPGSVGTSLTSPMQIFPLTKAPGPPLLLLFFMIIEGTA